MSDLRLYIDPPVARLVLDRQSRRNAMTAAMWSDLPKLCAEIEDNSQIDAVIVEGAGGHFCSGADISEFDNTFADFESAQKYLGAIEGALLALSHLDRPTLAKIRGSAIGGGLAVALACDLRIAADDAYFAIPAAKLGLIYGPVETRLLVEIIGAAAAKDLLFSGRSVAPSEALSLGLINQCVPDTSLDQATEVLVRRWAELSPASVRGAKKAVRAALVSRLEDVRGLVEGAAMGVDFREGRAAFSEKRSPRFSRGR
jgi:enoyl-CoA hydratase/carnithine racemase